ncbi:MAG: serine protease Do [Cryomorphaceae bacterium]|jgi:serine protease Do
MKHHTLKPFLSGLAISLGAITLPVFAQQTTEKITPRVNSSADQDKIDAAIAKVYPALVRIHVVGEKPKDGRMQKRGGTGSGTIIHPDGYVLTNHHVAGEGTRIWVRLSNKLKVDATLVGTDPQTDLCILKLNLDQIPADMKPLPVAKFGDFKTLNVGDSVLAMGSPAGVSQSVTLGVVANLEMIIPGNGGGTRQAGESVGDLVRWIGHDAIIYFGNSGGPLVNLKGEIIGINEIGLGSLGGAIPADIAKYVSNELIKNGTVRRSWTGIFPQPILISGAQKTGVLISTILENSPADNAGLKPGDIITEFDGIPVTATAREHLPLYNKVELGTEVGKEVVINYIKASNGKEATTKFTTIERSKAIGQDIAIREWGITARDLTPRSAINRKESETRSKTDGILVSSVSKTGPSAASKPAIAPGDLILKVNGEAIKDLAQFQKLTSELIPDEDSQVKAMVEFERNSQLLATVVDINKQPSTSQSTAAQKAWIGLDTQVLTRELATILNLSGKKGVRVTQIIPQSNADKAGIKQGDIILKMDGAIIPVERERDANIFNSMIREYPADESISFEIYRDQKSIKIKCDLETTPKPAKEFKKVINDVLEITLRELSKANAKEAEYQKGIYVHGVETAGWAFLAGLRAGDVILSINDKEVTDLAMIEKELELVEKKKQDYVVLFVKRGKFTRFLEIHPIWNK